MATRAKKLIVVSDLHCGHSAGLTPPKFQCPEKTRRGRLQREMWSKFVKATKKYGPFDAVICNGDAIDGKGTRSGGTELITTDRGEQVDIAVSCLSHLTGAKTSVLLTYGTPYHTGVDEDWEAQIAKQLGCKIGEHEWADVDGVIFDVKHFISGSGVATGRHTALNKEAMWSMIWAHEHRTPQPHVLIRSHVHYHAASIAADFEPRTRIITPALQAAATKYGARKCSGLVDFGFVVFTCQNKSFTWTCERIPLDLERAKTTIL